MSFQAVQFSTADITIVGALLVGLVAVVVIGESTNFFTSYFYKPTLRVS